VGLWICDPLALSRGGLARESAAVALGVLAHERPAARLLPAPARLWLKSNTTKLRLSYDMILVWLELGR
jgi:hypothetical protein